MENSTTLTNTVNGVDLDALSATTDAVAEQRDLGRFTFEVAGSWDGAVRMKSATGGVTQAGQRDESRVGQFQMRSDEPLALLGADTAVSPSEYVLQALAGCYTATLVIKAAARGIVLKSYGVAVEGDFDLAPFLEIAPEEAAGARQIRIKVDVDAPDASRQEIEDLVKLVEQCSPIRDTLVRPVDVVTTLA